MAASVYLYTGPEIGERNDAIQAIKESLQKKYGAVEDYLFYASETPSSDFMASLMNGSLFSDSIFVLVKNAESIKKKDDIELISQWISSDPEPSSVLIFISDEFSVDSKLKKIIPEKNQKVFWELSAERKKPWLSNWFSKNGYSLADDAAELILEYVENDTESLRKECSRFLVCFPKGTKISVADVESVLSHNREENAFSLFDTMANLSTGENCVLEKSLEVLQKVLCSKENEPIVIIGGLTSCFRKLENYHRLRSEGKTDDFNLKINGFSSRKMKDQYKRASLVWSTGQVAAILSLLSSTHMEILSDGSFFSEVALQRLVYEIVVKKGVPSQIYQSDLS